LLRVHVEPSASSILRGRGEGMVGTRVGTRKMLSIYGSMPRRVARWCRATGAAKSVKNAFAPRVCLSIVGGGENEFIQRGHPERVWGETGQGP